MSIKSLDLLPEIFRSETNQKFLEATLDQLIGEVSTVKVASFIGRQDAPTLTYSDTYVTEPTRDRKNYQLETSVVVKEADGTIDFYTTYVDLLQQIAYQGGITNDHSRLFSNKSYNFDGIVDFDKFVNFTQYLWMPNGPPEVNVSASVAPPFVSDFIVKRNTSIQSYQFTGFGADSNPILTLVKGNTYQFEVNQPGVPFWIQTRPGPDGAFSQEAEFLNRTILGLDNNGLDVGTVTFSVPSNNAQDYILSAKLAATVDFATPLSYNQVQSHLANLIKGGIDGVSNSLNGKTLVFLNRDLENEKWTDPGSFDTFPFDTDGQGFEYGLSVAGTQRYNVFRIQTVDAGSGRQLIKLIPSTEVAEGQKIFVKSGKTNSNVEFLKNSEGFFEPLQPATAPLTELYYQDAANPLLYGTIKLIDPTTSNVDIEREVIGQVNYTSPNGIGFTNGLVVRFDNTVSPSKYANNAFVVEGVGKGIKLISVTDFIVPEQFALSSGLSSPDYITINRAGRDLNAWSRSNRWFHIQTVEAAAKYRNDPTLLDISAYTRAKRPIIEFEADIYLFGYGQNAKSPVDIIDFTIQDAFNEVVGKLTYVVRLPNGRKQQLTPGTRIIFARDLDPDVRRRIYRVEYIVTAAGRFINLISQDTQTLPTYRVSGSLVTSNVMYNFLPTVSFEAPIPAIDTRQAYGRVVLTPTGVDYFTMQYSGINYIANPYVRINSDYTTAAQVDIVNKIYNTIDYVRVDNSGTGYASTSPAVTISNPNHLSGIVSNVSFGSTTFEITPTSISGSYTTTNVTVDGTSNLSVTWTSRGLGYSAGTVHANVTAANVPLGTSVTVNSVYLYANGAIKAVNVSTNGVGFASEPVLTITGANTTPAIGTLPTTSGPSDSIWNYVTVGMQVVGNGIIGGTLVNAIDNEANLVTLSSPVVPATLTGSVPVDKTGNLVATFTDRGLGYFSSNVSANIAPPTTSGTTANVGGIYLFANGAIQAINIGTAGSGYTLSPTITITGGNTTPASISTSVTYGLLDPTLTGPVVVSIGDSWVFKPNVDAGTYATVTNDLSAATTITVDDTSMIESGMIVSGGTQPIDISNIIISSVPTRVLLAADAIFQTGDILLVRGITGTTQLNNGRYYVNRITPTTFDLYTGYNSTTGLLTNPQDSRNFSDYISGGSLTSYTIDYSQTKVVNVLSSTQFNVNSPVTIKAGTELVFAGVSATAIARSDGNGIYSITVTDPGSGYLTTPSVSIVSSLGNQATATAIPSHGVIKYLDVMTSGTGYSFGDQLSVDIISNVSLQTSQSSSYGSNTLYFATEEELAAIQPGWLVFLVSLRSGNSYYTDFARNQYSTDETTGPNPSTYQFYMDVSKTTATVLKVQSVYSNTLVLTGAIDSKDSDGISIDLPAGSMIYATAQDIFFTTDGYGSSPPIVGSSRSTFTVSTAASETASILMDSVMGIQPGMLVQDLTNSLPTDLRVERVDTYLKQVILNKPVTVAAGLPVKLEQNGKFTLSLQPAGVDYIEVTDPGSGYVRAPSVTIQPLQETVVLATSLGTGANLDVSAHGGFSGISLGANVTSTYDVNGIGITTADTAPIVTNFYTIQTGTSTFQYLVQLSYPQPAFDGVLVTFTKSAKAVALVTSNNTSFVSGDPTPETYDVGDTVTVNMPTVVDSSVASTVAQTYNQFYYNGISWKIAQNKTTNNQAPLFDAFDQFGVSAGDTVKYPATKFTGTKLFGYTIGSGSADKELGFALKYQNFQNVGDIEFTNYFQVDSFRYLDGYSEKIVPIDSFTLRQGTGGGNYRLRNIWNEIPSSTRQRQIINATSDGITNYFQVDIAPEDSTVVPNVLVYTGGKLIDASMYSIEQIGGRSAVKIDPALVPVNTAVKIVMFSRQQSQLGYYEVPINLNNNPLNENFTTLTLGQVRSHFVEMSSNHNGVVGSILGSNNVRDLDIKGWQGSILQHASPVPLASMFLVNKDLDAIKAIKFSQQEYTKFKNRFLDTATRIEIDIKDIPGSVDKVMTSVMAGKVKQSVFYDSDMLPWGNMLKTVSRFQVLNIRQKSYLIPSAFDNTVLQTRSVLVYVNDAVDNRLTPLIVGKDFVFDPTISSIVISDQVQLAYTQTLVVYDYVSTLGCYVPATPTKLGLYPKFMPNMHLDSTYRDPIMVIEGHDGSITPAFGDFRDQLLLELEIRIYNNIKAEYETNEFAVGAGLYDIVPGKFRDTMYTRAEFNQLLTKTFLTWAGSSQVDYSSAASYDANDPFSWNYGYLNDRDGETLPGYWRAVYQYYYDTDRPNTHPWEMLGFKIKPDWWEASYGAAPYTGGNTTMWADLEIGFVAHGIRAGIDYRFARPGLSKLIPVDENGLLLPPSSIMLSSYDPSKTQSPFAVGDQGPVETAWRRSSDFPYAVQVANALARPALYFSNLFDTSRYYYNASLGQFLVRGTENRITTSSLVVPNNGLYTGSSVVLTAGYVNMVKDYLVYLGITNPSEKISKYITNISVNLSYKVAGYTDSNIMQIVAEQSSPTGTDNNIIIPNENYKIHLQKGAPLRRLIYSGVIVEVTARGWKVSGYNSTQPYFTVVPSQQNNNNYGISVLNLGATIYKDYQLRRVSVPYGFEFTSAQSIVDFLVCYQRSLLIDGITFNRYSTDLAAKQDWVLSAKEFLTWAQQGWQIGSILILSPVGNKLDISIDSGVISEITGESLGSKLLDQNFNLIKRDNFTVSRIGNNCTITTILGQNIALADLGVVEYEHALIFDNKTVFNDVIYVPSTGTRQYRLKLLGYKTNKWTGQLSAPGYIYNSGTVDTWVSRAVYGRGSLVDYKDQYYVAMKDVPASTEFDFSYWKPMDKTQIKTGLLPSFSNNADKFKNIYDVDNIPMDSTLEKYSAGLTGFRDRTYLQNLNLDTSTQNKFYQGYIQQKGTKSAIDALTIGNFDNVVSNITFYEEWALRVGSYGSSGGSQFLEVAMDESQFTYNPSTFVLLPVDSPTTYAGLINFTKTSIYRGSENYNPNLIQTRKDIKSRITDNVTAGYVRLDDIDGTIYDISEYAQHANLVGTMGAGFKLWTAVDFNKSWNVYRATETDNQLLNVTVLVGTRIQMEFSIPHGLLSGDFIAIKNFANKLYDGFYVVQTVSDNKTILVGAYQAATTLQQVRTQNGAGILFKMISVRYADVTNILRFVPPHGWRNNDRAWIDNDTGTGNWGVYQKTDGWNFYDLVPLRKGDDRYDSGYGSRLKLNSSNQILIASAPAFSSGSLLGLRVVNPGGGYQNPQILISAPTGENGILAQYLVTLSTGELLNANVTTSGFGYTLAPNIVISDSYTTITNASVLNTYDLPISGNIAANIYVGDNLTINSGNLTGFTGTVTGVNVSVAGTVTVAGNINTNTTYLSPTPVALSSANIGSPITFNAVTSGLSLIAGLSVRAYPYGVVTSYYDGTVAGFTASSVTVDITGAVGSGDYTSYLLDFQLYLPTGTNVSFGRGSYGTVTSTLLPTTVESIEILDGGSGFNLSPKIQIIGGGGIGATAEATVSGGKITSVTLTNGGAGYTDAPTVVLLTNNASPVQLIAKLKQTSLGSLKITGIGQNYRNPILTVVPSTNDGGYGANLSIASLYGNGGIRSVTVTNSGYSYLPSPYNNVDLYNTGTGSGFQANLYLGIKAASIVNRGTGYSVGNVLTIVGGTVTNNYYANILVTGVAALTGIINSFQIQDVGFYSNLPVGLANVSTTQMNGTSGNLATFNVTFGVANVTVYDPGSGYTVSTTANISSTGGVFGAATIQRTNNGIGTFYPAQTVNPGQGYLQPPTVTVIDNAGTGTGAVLEPIFPTGQVKTFVRPDQNTLSLQQTQTIVGYANDAREFGEAIDIGSLYGVIGAPGSYTETGSVLVAQCLGAQWISSQLLYAPGIGIGARFGHSVAISRDEQWIYVGAPGANSVYCYGKKSVAFGREVIVPVTDAGGNGITTYLTNFLALQSPYELTILGEDGKKYEPSFDYQVDPAGNILFTDYLRIQNQKSIYILRRRLQTTVIPLQIRNVLQYTYALASQPETIDQLLVYGASGRVFVPNREYTVVGSNIIFLDNSFAAEASIVITQKDVYYQLASILTPSNFGVSEINDDAQFGYSVRTDAQGFKILVGAPNTTEYVTTTSPSGIESTSTIVGAGRVFVYSRSYEVITTSGTQQIFTFNELNTVVSVTLDGQLLNNNIDYVVGGASITLSSTPRYGAQLRVDTNFFNILQIIPAVSIVNQGRFGDGVDISPDNKSLVVSSPGYRDDAYYNGTVYRYVNKGLFYGTLTGNKLSADLPFATAGDTLKINDTLVTFQNIIGDNELIAQNIRASKLSAITVGVDADGYVTVSINSGTSLKSLDIQPGNTGIALLSIGMEVYGLTQTLQHPRYGVPEIFGSVVKLDETGNTLAISSKGGNTLKTSTFDAFGTTFDNDTTRLIDSLNASGAVYIYDYLSPPGETYQAPGALLYNQVLQNSKVLTGDNFGSAIEINKDWAIVGADQSNYYSQLSGLIHVFINEKDTKGWSRLRQRGEKVDLDYVNKVLIYNKSTQNLIDQIDYYDPAKGKILGIADQDLDYKTTYDPASYNTSTRTDVTISSSRVWGATEAGNTWWDLGLCRFIDYEQGDLNYRSTHWGQFFPGSTIEVLEWVESQYLPSQYAKFVNDGVAKYADDSAYVAEEFFDYQTGLTRTRYYYWVRGKKDFDRTQVNRLNSVINLENIIRDPLSQNIAYLSVLRSDAFSIYNVRDYLKSSDVVLRMEYSRVITNVIAHNEYELVQQGNELSVVPTKLISKLIDSLASENSAGQIVPDLRLSAPDAYGIELLPRQSMLIDPQSGGRVFVNFVNTQLAKKAYTEIRNLYRFYLVEPTPPANVGFYHAAVDNVDQLSYIPATELFVGYLVLVNTDSTYRNFWTIYRWDGDLVGFRMVRIQSYDTTRWWTPTDWYATGYNQYTDINFVVSRFSDVYKLNTVAGNIIKILNDSKRGWGLYIVENTLSLTKIGSQFGTLQLNASLYDFAQSFTGFDNAAFDQVGFSTTQSVELRNIVEGVVYDLLINEDKALVNDLFFTMLNYILSEQPTVDWALKTSLISVLHKIRKLEQFPNYKVDNQSYYQSYINEVKPYRTQIRDYLLDYQGTDVATTGLTDFDLSSVYDKNQSRFRTLDYRAPGDYSVITATANNAWYKNFSYSIQSLALQSGGVGYTQAPTVSVVGGGGQGALAEAALGAFSADGTASVAQIVLTNPGTGYTSQPTIVFNGGNGYGAVASAVLQDSTGPVTIDTLNRKIRNVLTTIKFDRISYTSTIRAWKPYELYRPGTIIMIPDVRLQDFSGYTDRQLPRFNFAYRVISTLLGTNELEINLLQDKTKLELLTGSQVGNASDRLAIYNQPGSPDHATIVNSPDLVRFESSPLNSLIVSVANQWNGMAHSKVVPANHQFQFAAVGDRALIAVSVDGLDWVTTNISDQAVNARDVTFYNGDTWMAVGNQGAVFYSLDGVNWTVDPITSYRFKPVAGNINGTAQNNAASSIDITSIASVDSTFAKYVIVVANNGLILANARGNTTLPFTGKQNTYWYKLSLQNYSSLPQNYLKVLSIVYGNLQDVDGTTYDVELIPGLGYYATSTGASTQHALAQLGYVITIGTNGAINMISYLALDDVMQGYANGYNYDTDGKAGDLNYPWLKMTVPAAVRGLGDGLSGQQLNSIATSGESTGYNRWIVTVGSSGTILWNRFDTTLRIRPGRAALGSATSGRTVVDHQTFAFDNFRYFDDNNFVAPLTREILQDVNLNQIQWDGEKFVIVGNNGLILWGYPGTQANAYIEITDITNAESITSVRPSAEWTNYTPTVPVTSITAVISNTDLDATQLVPGMTCYASGIPSDAVVSSTSYNAGTGQWSIDLSFGAALVANASASSIGFSYVLTANIAAGSTITASTGQVFTTASGTSNNDNSITVLSTAGMQAGEPVIFSGTMFSSIVTSAGASAIVAGQTYYIHSVIDSTNFTISTTSHGDVATLTTASGSMGVQAGNQLETQSLNVSAAATKGSTRIYISNFSEQVQSNWRLSGTGLPAGARIKWIGKFPSFQWKQATGNSFKDTSDYRAVAVNDTLVTISKALSASTVPTYPAIDAAAALPLSTTTERAIIAADVASRQAANISIRAGDVITLFDTTGTRLQVRSTQDIRANVSIINLGIGDLATLATGYRFEANAMMGIADGTIVAGTKNYVVGGVISKLVKDIPDNIPGTEYSGTLVTGQAYKDTATDPLTLDTNINSSYTDSQLGQRPEDIVVTGGQFIDTYSSHAPEELVPGQLIDSLQMTVFTANILSGTIDFCDVITYKMFTDYQLSTVYYNVPANSTTVLLQDLYYSNTSIAVSDVSKLPDPGTTQNILGAVWINGEKISYAGIDRVNGLLTDIRRGVNRTSVPVLHAAGSLLTDASSAQVIDQDTVLTITQDLTVYNGIPGTANSATYLAVTTSSVPQSHIWQDDINS